MRKGWLRLVVGFASAVAASAAFGDAFLGSNPATGKLTWSGFSNGSVGASITGAIVSNVQAGQFFGFFDTDGGSAEADDFLRFFCIDLGQFANGGPNTYMRDLGLPASLSAAKQAELARLFDEYYPNKTVGTYYSGGAQTTFGSFASANDSAAFQLAVWEIFFGDGTDLTKAPFIASSAAESTAQGWLDAINAESGTPAGWTFYSFDSPYYQDYLSVEYTRPLRTVPEPDSLLLLCSAVLAAWAAALRRRQTA